jgi:hypothetical protein
MCIHIYIYIGWRSSSREREKQHAQGALQDSQDEPGLGNLYTFI